MQKIKVKVTQEHINNGCRSSMHNCPVAIAINETLADVHATVTRYHIKYFVDEQQNVVIPSKTLSDAIEKYDLTGTMQPINFFMTINKG